MPSTAGTAIARARVLLFIFTTAVRSKAFLQPKVTSARQNLTRKISPSSATATRRWAVPKVEKTKEEWRSLLPPDAFYVLHEEGTEPPFSSGLNDVKSSTGAFVCRGCGSPLFPASTKFESGSGWPSFYDPIDADAVELRTDYKLVLPRNECLCAACGGHLGHVFPDGPQPSGMRYCMNGLAMEYRSEEEDPELAQEVAERAAKGSGPGTAVGVKLPAGSLVAGIALNGGLTVLIVMTFLSPHPPDSNPLLEYFPLVAAGYTGWQAARDVMRML